MHRGKEKCQKLKAIRKMVADKYGLSYNPRECTHEGNCTGTCPVCDAELRDLNRQLAEKGLIDLDQEPDWDDFSDLDMAISERREPEVLGGIPAPPDFIEEREEGIVLQSDVSLPNDETIVVTEGMPAPPYIERIKKKDRVLYKQCNIAGITFHDLDDTWDELYEGAQLALVRERDNKHDKYAVAVALADDYDGNPEDFDFDFILGYVPRGENEHIATMLDMGWADAFDCELTKITGNNPYKGSLQMSIYIVSKEEREEIDTSRQIRALELYDEEFTSFLSDLKTKGCTYFRWGGFPPWEHDFPSKGDKVVFLHKNDKTTELYLMYCIANNDDDAYYFVEDKEMLHAVDDCCFYVFTNIAGPVQIKSEELAFLSDEHISSEQAEDYLSEQATTKLMSLFI